jgi:IS1 family transposase
LTKEGVGILRTARLLNISPTTLLKRIKEIADKITPPAISIGKTYEIDEMRTFYKHNDKLVWIVYALEKESRKVVSFNVGARTNKTLSKVIETLSLSNLTLRIHLKRLNSRSLAFSRCVVVYSVLLKIYLLTFWIFSQIPDVKNVFLFLSLPKIQA